MLTIQVNKVIWNVKLTDNAADLIVKNKVCKGAITYKDRTMYIDKSLCTELRERVIRHELSHIYLYETQINLTDCFSEEAVCEFMAIYGKQIEYQTNYIMKNIK